MKLPNTYEPSLSQQAIVFFGRASGQPKPMSENACFVSLAELSGTYSKHI
jgi:hypothetical protein